MLNKFSPVSSFVLDTFLLEQVLQRWFKALKYMFVADETKLILQFTVELVNGLDPAVNALETYHSSLLNKVENTRYQKGKRKYILEGVLIGLILWNLFVTIDVNEVEQAMQEYYHYAPELLDLLASAKSDKKDSEERLKKFMIGCVLNEKFNIICPNGKKTTLLFACAFVESEPFKVYNTGSRASTATCRRERAMELITKIEIHKRIRPPSIGRGGEGVENKKRKETAGDDDAVEVAGQSEKRHKLIVANAAAAVINKEVDDQDSDELMRLSTIYSYNTIAFEFGGKEEGGAAAPSFHPNVFQNNDDAATVLDVIDDDTVFHNNNKDSEPFEFLDDVDDFEDIEVEDIDNMLSHNQQLQEYHVPVLVAVAAIPCCSH